jgi:hypothetical protein
MLCIPAFEPLLWVLSSYLVVRIIQEDKRVLWPWVGLLGGIGLMTKHSTLFLGFGLVVGLVLTPQRKHLRSPWLYVAGAIAGLLLQRRNWNWLRPASVGTLAVTGALMAPLSLPILPIDATDRYITTMTLGAFGNVFELTGDLHGQFGWKERVQIVAGVYKGLPAEERERTVILASWYGPAGAIDYFGGAYGLPKAVSGHMTYYLWGLPKQQIDTVLAVDMRQESLREWFEDVSIAAQTELENVNPWKRRFVVAICRKPKADLRALWPKTRRW